MEDFGLSYKYYQRLESGQVNPTLLTLHKLALAFEVAVYDLFRTEQDSDPLSLMIIRLHARVAQEERPRDIGADTGRCARALPDGVSQVRSRMWRSGSSGLLGGVVGVDEDARR